MTTITLPRATAQQALECLRGVARGKYDGNAAGVCAALEAALAEPVQEPIGFANANALQGLTLGLYGYAEIYTDDSAGRIPVYAAPQRPAKPQEPVQEPVAWMYTGIKSDGTEHGPHLVWKPAYMDAMSASKGAKATPLYTAPPQPAEPVQEPDDKAASIRWQLCLLAQTEEFSDDVRNQIARGVWLIDRLRATLAEPQEPVQEPWEHLKPFGYAPGNYMSRCHACDKIASGVDKRAITCRPCAEVRHAALAQPVQCADNDSPWLICKPCAAEGVCKQAQPVEPVAWMYTGIKQDDTEHGPHLVWKPAYMDAMSASKGAQATPLYTSPPQRKPLTAKELRDVLRQVAEGIDAPNIVMTHWPLVGRAVERAHKIGVQP